MFFGANEQLYPTNSGGSVDGRCTATTAAGTRCLHAAVIDGYCSQHYKKYRRSAPYQKKKKAAPYYRPTPAPATPFAETFTPHFAPLGFAAATPQQQQPYYAQPVPAPPTPQPSPPPKAAAKETVGFIPRSPRAVKSLSGIISFTFYPNVLGRRILITGEMHMLAEDSVCDPSPTSYQYHTWVRDLADAAPQCLDVILEDPLPTKKVEGVQQSWTRYKSKDKLEWAPHVPKGEHRYNDIVAYNSAITATSASFERCFSSSAAIRMACAGTSIRVHEVDLRSASGERSALFDQGSTKRDSMFWCNDHRYDPALMLHLLEFLTGLDTSSANKALYHSTLEKWVTNDLKRPYERDREGFVLQTLGIVWEKASKKLDAQINELSLKRALVKAYMDREAASARPDYSSIAIFDMDMYALYRMFMMFDQEKLPRGPPGCREFKFNKLRNVIFHAGNRHSENVRAVFDTMWGLKPTVAAYSQGKFGPRSACVVLPDYFDFFAN